MRRYIVTGSRDWEPTAVIEEVFRRLASRYRADEITIVHGACPTGVDATADRIARRYGFAIERHPADWDKYGKAAGPRRNSEMVRAGAAMCLAFSRDIARSKGTKNCAGKAAACGIHVMLWYGDDYSQCRQYGIGHDLDQ